MPRNFDIDSPDDGQQEAYRDWVPATWVPSELFLDKVVDDEHAFSVFLLSGTGQKYCCKFIAPIAYRYTGEGHRLRTWKRMEKGRHRDGEACRSLFTVENSEWLEWLQEESCGVLCDRRPVHYAIFTDNDCVEIVAETPPEFFLLHTDLGDELIDSDEK